MKTNMRKLQRNIPLDYIAAFISNLNMQGCIWVLYLAYRGLNLMEIGIMEGIYHATSIVCEIPSGAAADLFGRKRCMLLSRICIAASCLIMLFADKPWLFALSFMIQALGNNLNSGSEEALIYDSMKAIDSENDYIGVCGKLNVIIEVSQQIATIAGGVLAEYSYFACYGASLFIAVMAIIPVLFMEEAYTKENADTGIKRISVYETVKMHFKISMEILKADKRILKNISFFSTVFAVYTLLFFYSQQYYTQLGYNKIELSFIMFLAGLASCAGAIISEKVYAKLGKKLIFVGALCVTLAFVFYGMQNTVVSVVAFSAASFLNSMLYPVQSDLLNGLIPSEQRATLISINSMFFSIAMIIMFPIAGALADIFGLTQVLAGLGLVVLIFVLATYKFIFITNSECQK